MILIGHPPRYDHKRRVDLAILANTILQHLCSLSPLKGKVCFGLHDLFSYGIGHTHMKRFRDIVTGDYDGIHMWGPTGRKDYTNSFIKILYKSIPKLSTYAEKVATGQNPHHWKEVKTTQVKAGLKQKMPLDKKTHQTNYVHTQNRFQPLAQGNF